MLVVFEKKLVHLSLVSLVVLASGTAILDGFWWLHEVGVTKRQGRGMKGHTHADMANEDLWDHPLPKRSLSMILRVGVFFTTPRYKKHSLKDCKDFFHGNLGRSALWAGVVLIKGKRLMFSATGLKQRLLLSQVIRGLLQILPVSLVFFSSPF